MRMRMFVRALAFVVVLMGSPVARAAEPASFTRTEDVIYGRKYGTALTLDVFAPKENGRGAAIIHAVSGGWFSSHEAIRPAVVTELVNRGYTVFAVVHGSQPKFTIPEVLEDMNRAVRFVRYHARDYSVDPERFGITGSSAGGHLSLMIGMAGAAGDPNAKDPVDRVSSRVQAVACFFPPTDFLNYGESDRDVFRALEEELSRFKAPFDFRELDEKTRRFVLIEDIDKRRAIAREISPISHVSADDPPTLILHGDADNLVPIQQAEAMVRKLEEVEVEAKLIVKPGAGHGWAGILDDMTLVADWFDAHLGGGKGGHHGRRSQELTNRGGHLLAGASADGIVVHSGAARMPAFAQPGRRFLSCVDPSLRCGPAAT